MTIKSLSNTMPILEVKNFSFYFSNCPDIPVVDDVSFSLYPNEFLAIIGESGSGKSVTAKAILQLNSHGGRAGKQSQIKYGGKNLLTIDYESIRKIRGKEIGLVFQDPMTYLNPTLTVGYQIEESFRHHFPHYTKIEAYNKTLELIALVELSNQNEIYKRYPHELSGGMRQRVMIAISLAAKPRIFIADEITTALDVTLQKEILFLLKKLQKEIAMSIIFITHDLSLVASFADSIAVMYGGKIMEYGSCREVCNKPSHPYTKALINSIPTFSLDPKDRLETISEIRDKAPSGCIFYNKCKNARDLCKVKPPCITKLDNKDISCHYPIKTPTEESSLCQVTP